MGSQSLGASCRGAWLEGALDNAPPAPSPEGRKMTSLEIQICPLTLTSN